MIASSNKLKLKRIFIDTQIEHVVYMRKDCTVCKSEGFESLSRVKVKLGRREIVASLNLVTNGMVTRGYAGLSEGAWKALKARNGTVASFSHPRLPESMKHVRAKMFRKKLSGKDFDEILHDIVAGAYSNVELSAFITACAGDSLDLEEIIALTRSMVATGKQLSWDRKPVVDKHCVGGLPGNRTTPIVVAIAAEAGVVIPKTSSRAITSPAGTADTMGTMTNVELSMKEIRRVVEKENGCIVWGGSVKLSPADDILIRIERALDVDSDAQMIASVLSKKRAAGSTHVVVDIPTGKTAKVRSRESAEKLSYFFRVVGEALKIKVQTVITDGSQPVGRGIGPALEAMDVLAVLRNEVLAPADLRERALLLAGEVLEMAGKSKKGAGMVKAREILDSGRAYRRFVNICLAQGRFTEPEAATAAADIKSRRAGTVKEIDNRRLSRIAKLAGAPRDVTAGMRLNVRLNQKLAKGETLFTVHAKEKGALNYALEYLKRQPEIIKID